MQKVKEFCGTKYFSWLLMALGTLGILVYYGVNIPHMNAVWSLADEYGYLVNAAYLSGKEWGYFSNMYYGYGYSLWLIPVFLLAQTGMQVIKGAMLVNTLFIVATFWIEIALMSRLFKNLSRNVIIVISLVLCIYPYMISSDTKVICECLLTMMIWLCGLLAYQALSTGKWYYYVLVGFSLAYTFFVHTRAFVFIGAFFLLMLAMLVQKKISKKNFLIFMIVVVISFAVGYMMQSHIIDVVYSNNIFSSVSTSTSTVANDSEQIVVGNTLTVSYVISRIINVLKSIQPKHLYSVVCKIFYLFVGTAGMFHVGIFAAVKNVIAELREKKEVGIENGIKIMYVIAAVLMIAALVINNPGYTDNTAYFFYGRYYEYLIGPVIFLGVIYFIENKVKIKEMVVLLILLFVSFYFTLELANYLETQEFYYDSGRIVAFSLITSRFKYYRAVIRCGALMSIGLIVAIFIMNRIGKMRYLIPGVLGILYLLNGHVIMKNTISMHGQDNHYYAIATYLHTNCEQDEIYFVNKDEIRVTAYTGIQSLLLNQKLILIEPSDIDVIEPGEWFVTFQLNDHIANWDREVTKVTETSWFVIYQAE